MKKSIAYITSAFLVTGAYGQSVVKDGTEFPIQLNTITTAVPFLVIAPDSRASGMGDAGVATSPDANSFHWNTSKLAFSKEKAEFVFGSSEDEEELLATSSSEPKPFL
jgi:hypothetical protein